MAEHCYAIAECHGDANDASIYDKVPCLDHQYKCHRCYPSEYDQNAQASDIYSS